MRASRYRLATLLGNVSAIQKGRIGRRAARRIAGKATGRWLGKFFR
jgi:hypothetical protein